MHFLICSKRKIRWAGFACLSAPLLLQQICDFISVFDEVIDKLSDNSRSTLRRAIPLRQHLIDLCSISDNDNDTDNDNYNLIHLKRFIGTSRLRSINH